MFKIASLAAILVLAVSLGAQTANVIELEPADTAKAQKAWDALQRAQKDWDAVVFSMNKQYIAPPIPCTWGSSTGEQGPAGCSYPKKGFESGFEFSKDFKFIVPKSAEFKQGIYPAYTLPAVGTLCTECR